VAARELLTETGSCFVQISDENVHLIRNLMDEVFGSENFVTQIFFQKTSGAGSPGELLAPASVGDYIIWYSKNISHKKYRPLFAIKGLLEGGADAYKKVLLKNGEVRSLTAAERKDPSLLPDGARVFRIDNITSQSGVDKTRYPVSLNGKIYTPGKGVWKTSKAGMDRLIELGRVYASEGSLGYVRFLDDFPATQMNSLWTDTAISGASEKVYVVQTITKVLERCILMCTDPGDIILDPTCGSGTTAYVAEQWGRRWITMDTSRVALALARTRLMSAKLSWYKLKDGHNIRNGFEYKTVPHVTLKSLANNEQSEQEILYDQPYEDKDRVRVSGPFTVESLSPHRVSDEQEMLSTENYVNTIIENMRRAGIQTGDKGARVEFENLDILPGGPEVQARGEYRTEEGLKIAAIAIGPEFGSIDDDMIRDAVAKAKQFADLLVVAGTSFDASASTEPSEVSGMRIMKVKINPDLSMGDLLKKTQSANLFMAFGEPDIGVKTTKEGVVVEIKGVDVYDPVKGEIRSSGSGNPEYDIACWFIDTNYDGKSFFVSHAYFLGENEPFEKLKKALKAEISEEAWDSMNSTVSRPFPMPTSGKIAVKAINHFGDEVMKVIWGK
jgi:adenine-specific DNA-methyltransferase